MLAGPQELGAGLVDLATVAVGERLGPTVPFPHLEAAQVDLDGQAWLAVGRIRDGDGALPAGGLDDQVVPGPGGHAFAEGAQDQVAVPRTDLVLSSRQRSEEHTSELQS